jgi:hypothetical protein
VDRVRVEDGPQQVGGQFARREEWHHALEYTAQGDGRYQEGYGADVQASPFRGHRRCLLGCRNPPGTRSIIAGLTLPYGKGLPLLPRAEDRSSGTCLRSALTPG